MSNWITPELFLAQKLSNKPFTIVGSGLQTRDFTYVSDVIDAFLKSSKSKLSNKILNVGSGRTVSVQEIVKLLGGNKVYIEKRPGEPKCTFADITQIKKKLNWKPKIKIDKGIRILLDNLDYWKKLQFGLQKKSTKQQNFGLSI